MLGRGDFAGLWQLTRLIDDRHGQMRGDFTGTAELTPVGDDLLDYVENGQMRFGDAAPMTATRRYLWQFVADLVQVRFADGREFHSFTPAGQVAGTAKIVLQAALAEHIEGPSAIVFHPLHAGGRQCLAADTIWQRARLDILVCVMVSLRRKILLLRRAIGWRINLSAVVAA